MSALPPDFIEKLRGISPKAARAFEYAGEEIYRDLPPDRFQTWFTLGSLIAYGSSANGIKFFNDSPDILRTIGGLPGFNDYLKPGIQLAVENNSMALDYFRVLPLLAGRFSPDLLSEWAKTGNLLAADDYLAGTEYFKSGPDILPVLDISLMEQWGKIGLLLSRADVANKRFHAIEFFRTTPKIFSKIRDNTFHPVLLKIGHSLAMQFPEETNLYFQTIQGILESFLQEEGLHLIFLLAFEISVQLPAALLDFLKNAADILKMAGGNFTSFKTFVEEGLKMKSQPAAARSYFSLKSRRSVEILRELSHTVFLSDVTKRLKYFAEMTTGVPVELKAGPIPGSLLKEGHGIITVPEKLGLYAGREENFRLYKLLVLHEAAHLEFGTYLPLSQESLSGLKERSGGNEITNHPPRTAWDYFPNTTLARNLWMIAEESRIDYFLRLKYPGAMRELHPLLDARRENRPDLFQLPDEKAILEALFQLSFHDDITVPLPIADLVSQVFSILKSLWRPSATVDDTFQTVCRIYRVLSPLFKATEGEKPEFEPILPGEEVSNYGASPQSAFAHHGLATPDLAFQTESAPFALPQGEAPEEKPGDMENSPGSIAFKSRNEAGETSGAPAPPTEKDFFLYPEWDWMSREYKPDWCRLVEKKAESSSLFSGRNIPSYGTVLSIRRYFEKLRPENYMKSRREKDGETFDLDLLVDAIIDIRAGISPPENFYVRRQKKERKVSVAFLIDLSGSTRQILGEDGRRIIDLEKESLSLIGEALDAIGDEYGIFGFSGQSRNGVDFYTIKGFEEADRTVFNLKINGLEPLQQNRDGAAIRHMTRKLSEREAKIKLLMVISDGKPLDDDYADLYALEDTRMALKEARNRGIHPFCITVDREATHYIKKMYQDVHYTIISDIRTLPTKLPQIYKKLTT